MILALMLAAASPVAVCAHPALTPSLRSSMCLAIRRGAGAAQPVKAGEISDIMDGGDWRLVWATPAESERGVYFLTRSGSSWKYIDVWGGVIAPEERASTIAWAQQRGRKVPAALAICFADALLAGN